MNQDNNPFVFPVCHNGNQTVTQGVRLRAWLAGQALGGISGAFAGYTVEGAAQRACQLADAIIA